MNRRLNGLDLFSGIGGNTLGLREYIKTIAYCEADRHAQSVLLSRMGDGSIESAPIWDDIKTLTGSHFDTPIDIIIGGFPCQDISVAGRGEGIVEGNRSGLFFEIVRLAKEIKPTFLFLENVPAIRTRGMGTVIQELTEIGYDLRWTMLSAQEVGANHKRDRWFCLGYSKHNGLLASSFSRSDGKNDREKQEGSNEPCEPTRTSEHREISRYFSQCNVSNSDRMRELQSQRCQQVIGRWPSNICEDPCDSRWWSVEPNVGRVVNGVSFRVDRIKRLGNAVVPLQAKAAFKELIGIK